MSLQISFIAVLWAVASPSIIISIWAFDIQERKSIRPTFSAEGIYGGTLLAVRSNEFICFYDWAECRVVRRIDVVVKVKLAFCYTWNKLCISIIMLFSPIPWLSRLFVDHWLFVFTFFKFESGMSSYIICCWWYWWLCYFFFQCRLWQSIKHLPCKILDESLLEWMMIRMTDVLCCGCRTSTGQMVEIWLWLQVKTLSTSWSIMWAAFSHHFFILKIWHLSFSMLSAVIYHNIYISSITWKYCGTHLLKTFRRRWQIWLEH